MTQLRLAVPGFNATLQIAISTTAGKRDAVKMWLTLDRQFALLLTEGKWDEEKHRASEFGVRGHPLKRLMAPILHVPLVILANDRSEWYRGKGRDRINNNHTLLEKG